MRDALDRPASGSLLRKSYIGLVSLAMAWTVFNCVYVYLVLNGGRSYRIEAAAFVLVLLMLPLVIASRRQESYSIEISPAQKGAIVSIALGLWVATFLPLIGFPFLSDDYVFLSLYRTLDDVVHGGQFYRPAFAAVFFVLARVRGGSSIPFHAASLLLHLAAAFLVYSLARLLFATSAPAILCFVVFLLNPLQLEATLWASGLQELLWAVFILAALRCYIGARVLSLPRLLVTLTLVGCALLSKETAVCFVLLLPAADWLFFRAKRGPVLPAAYAIFGMTLVAYLLLRQRFVSIESSFLFLPSRYFVKQFLATPYRFFVQPWNASAVHLPVLIQCLASLVIIGLLFIAIVVRRASPNLLSGPVVIIVSTLPLYSYFFVGPDLASSRYIYFASVGWALLVSQLLVTIIRSRAVLSVTIVMLAVAYFVSLQLNLRPWRTAADFVTTMQSGLGHKQPADRIVAEWQTRTGVTLELTNGIPRGYHGVYIFLNGYPEFVRLVHGE
jgi:hypothetical protein